MYLPLPSIHADRSVHPDLAKIVADASFLWERLDRQRFAVTTEATQVHQIEERLHRWCQEVAPDNPLDTLNKRLAWDNLDLDSVRPCLGSVSLTDPRSLPHWAETLGEIIRVARQFRPYTDEVELPIASDEPVAFEHVLLPAIIVARQKLLTRLGCSRLASTELPVSVLSAAAYGSLQRSLLLQLATLAEKVLHLEFSARSPFGRQLVNLLSLQDDSIVSTTQYRGFVDELLQDGLSTLFRTYPVLGRLLAMSVDLWVEATAEFVERLTRDRDLLRTTFGGAQEKLMRVEQITASVSDPHNGGRSVILLTWDSGLRVVYKPRNLGLAVAWNQLLDWCNRREQLLELKPILAINRGDYGWVEHVDHESCADEQAAKRFYQRAGMLLCLIYVMRGNDCHYENLIASGEHLVLIDMETLLHHEANVIDDSPMAQAKTSESQQLFWDSVLRTGMLPRWDFSADKRTASDVSGLGSTHHEQVRQTVPLWRAINTDDMHVGLETVPRPIEKNVPLLREEVLFTHDYQGALCDGFSSMYHFLMDHKSALLASRGPLAAFQKQQVRFVFRSTRVYAAVLELACAPNHLKSGADYSIELDRLSHAYLVAQTKPNAWPILSAEVRALEQLDVPFFTACTSSSGLTLPVSGTIADYFKAASFPQVRQQIVSLDETDLRQQLAIIQGSFHASVAKALVDSRGQVQEALTSPASPLSSPQLALSAQQLVQEARTIAAELEARALHDQDGSLNWIGMGFVRESERFQLQLMGNGMYDGRCGVAVFFAGLYSVTQEARFMDAAQRVVQPLIRQLEAADPRAIARFARLTGIGGATGLGSIVYGLVKLHQLAGVQTLQAAHRFADLITQALITEDRQLDVVGGAAGAILGLLALHEASREAATLETARACGDHLLLQKVSLGGGREAWCTVAKHPMCGFSHGAAGIAYALTRLYAVSGERRYLEAALQGIEYERSVFSELHGNWPWGRQVDTEQEESTYLVQWCHGAAGIGLARLGGLGVVDEPGIAHEIEIALRTTHNHGMQPIDHVCCGNLGRAEVLLVAARQPSYASYRELALQQASAVIARARHTGAYHLFPNLPNSVYNPGFFQGMAGIGYGLLRLADDSLPSVLLWE